MLKYGAMSKLKSTKRIALAIAAVGTCALLAWVWLQGKAHTSEPVGKGGGATQSRKDTGNDTPSATPPSRVESNEKNSKVSGVKPANSDLGVRHNTSSDPSLLNLTTRLLRSNSIADVEYALYGISSRCTNLGVAGSNAADWLASRPRLLFKGQPIGSDVLRVAAIHQLQQKCGEIQSSVDLSQLTSAARSRARQEATPTQTLINLSRLEPTPQNQSATQEALVSVFSEPALGYLSGFADKFIDYVDISQLVKRDALTNQDDAFLVRKAILDMALCEMGEDCSKNSLHYLYACANYAACEGLDTREAYVALYAASGLDSTSIREAATNAAIAMKRGGEGLIWRTQRR